jgi:hypothetical protein
MTVELEIFMNIWSRFRISNISDIKSKMRINSRQAARREPKRTQRCIKLEKKTREKECTLEAGIQNLMNISELLEQKVHRTKQSWKNPQRMGYGNNEKRRREVSPRRQILSEENKNGES